MSAPDADELAVRARLHRLFNPPPPHTTHSPDPDDWWDRLYTNDEPEPAEGSATPTRPLTLPAQPAAAPPAPPTPASSRNSHRQSLLDAWAGIAPRTRWLIYHGTAAAFGWGLGIVSWATHVTAWIAAGRWVDPQSITCYLLGLGTVALYRRTRCWWWPVAWMAAVPASSIVTGVLLYAPNS